MEIKSFLSYLNKVKKCSDGWTALCPGHDDKEQSLSVRLADNGNILIHCHAGCDSQRVLESMGLSWKDVFPLSKNYKKLNLTVEQLAYSKGFSEVFLTSLGVVQQGGNVQISYYLETGKLASRNRIRKSIVAKNGSFWSKGEGKPVPYGLWKLQEAKQKTQLFVVEGESDCWTFWLYNIPTIGIPGATMCRVLDKKHLDGIRKIYIIKEPGSGGEAFLKGMRERLKELKFGHLVFVIEMQKYKDPNEIHLKSKDFLGEFSLLQTKAIPVSLQPGSHVNEYSSFMPPLPNMEDKTVIEKMTKNVNTENHFVVIAPQGSGKSYANSYTAVEECKKGRSVILLSRSHDELKQLGKTIKKLLLENNMPEYHLLHLQKSINKEISGIEAMYNVRPIIVIAPHIYFQFKGETPYHHALVNLLINQEFGEKPLVIIDELQSFLESSFLSKPLGARESIKKLHGQKLYVKNKGCPLSTFSGNCLNCSGNMHLLARKGNGGMFVYQTFTQRHEDDNVKKEKVDFKNTIMWEKPQEDNTMRAYPISPNKKLEDRIWSQGSKGHPELPISLQFWYEDVISRMTRPHVIFFYPYDMEKKQIIARELNAQEIEERKNGYKIAVPKQVCKVPILQGWDLAILKKISTKAQIVMTGPGLSEAERFVIKDVLGAVEYYLPKKIYTKFEKVLIITLDESIGYENIAMKEMLKTWTTITKVLSFLPTYEEAKRAQKLISGKIKTMYYDGCQKIQDAPIEGTSIEYDLCVSCIHGALGQGINLGQFKIALVSTDCERPKFLFANHPQAKSNKEYIIDDVAEKSRQAALRILRLEHDRETPDSPRIIFFYGKNAYNVGQKVHHELTKVGHNVKIVHANTSIEYVEKYTTRWLANQNTKDLDQQGSINFQRESEIESIKTNLSIYMQKNENKTWRDVERKFSVLRKMEPGIKKNIKTWFDNLYEESSLEKLVNKINMFIKQYPKSSWAQIKRKFNLHKKNRDEMTKIMQAVQID